MIGKLKINKKNYSIRTGHQYQDIEFIHCSTVFRFDFALIEYLKLLNFFCL